MLLVLTQQAQSIVGGNFMGEMNLGGELLISKKKKNAFIYKLDNTGVAIWGNKIEGVFQNKNIFLANDRK